MKKESLLVLLAIGLVACGKGDDENAAPGASGAGSQGTTSLYACSNQIERPEGGLVLVDQIINGGSGTYRLSQVEYHVRGKGEPGRFSANTRTAVSTTADPNDPVVAHQILCDDRSNLGEGFFRVEGFFPIEVARIDGEVTRRLELEFRFYPDDIQTTVRDWSPLGDFIDYYEDLVEDSIDPNNTFLAEIQPNGDFEIYIGFSAVSGNDELHVGAKATYVFISE